MEVFLLGTDAWRRIRGINIPEGLHGAGSAGAFCNGAVHWLVRRARGDGFVNAIASFHLKEEKFNDDRILLPDVEEGVLFEGLRIHREVWCYITVTGLTISRLGRWRSTGLRHRGLSCSAFRQMDCPQTSFRSDRWPWRTKAMLWWRLMRGT